jgi:hypothetical protein
MGRLSPPSAASTRTGTVGRGRLGYALALAWVLLGAGLYAAQILRLLAELA